MERPQGLGFPPAPPSGGGTGRGHLAASATLSLPAEGFSSEPGTRLWTGGGASWGQPTPGSGPHAALAGGDSEQEEPWLGALLTLGVLLGGQGEAPVSVAPSLCGVLRAQDPGGVERPGPAPAPLGGSAPGRAFRGSWSEPSWAQECPRLGSDTTARCGFDTGSGVTSPVLSPGHQPGPLRFPGRACVQEPGPWWADSGAHPGPQGPASRPSERRMV